jgi:betaine-aldehyde dehydrogenase
MSATTPEELDRRAGAAHKALPGWARDARRRAGVMLQWGEALLAHSEELVAALVDQTGKPIREARAEVLGAAEALRYNAGLCRHIGGRAGTLSDGHVLHLVREPVGSTAFVVPWNWPLLLLMRDLAPGLAAGVTALMKPSPQTAPVTARALDLGHRAGVPEDVVQLVVGDGAVGDALVRHRLIRAVSFTGSTPTGRAILRAAAEDMTRPLLELGGKGVTVLFPDCDVDRAVESILSAAFITAGQMCMACTRVLVHERIHREVRDRLVEGASALRVGDPREERSDIGPLVSEAQAKRVMGYVDLARAGATVHTGRPAAAPGGTAGQLRLPHRRHRRRPELTDRPGRRLRPRCDRGALRRRGRGRAGVQRHPVRSRRRGVDCPRAPRLAGGVRRLGRRRLGERLQQVLSRDAQRRVQAVRPGPYPRHRAARAVHRAQERALHRGRGAPTPPAAAEVDRVLTAG